MTELETDLAQYNALLESQVFQPELLDYSVLDHHIKTLSFLEDFEGNYYEIFDMYRREHLYFTKSFQEHFGFSGETDFDRQIHPEDMVKLVKLGVYFTKMVFAMPVEERKNYKLCNEFRVKNQFGEYVRVLKQYRLLEQDAIGNIWLTLGLLTPAPDNDPSSPVRSKLVHIPSGIATVYKIEHDITAKETPLSEREIGILAFIAKGLSSKQIADRLYLSNSTVNTHRQNIIRKLAVQNTTEAVQYAIISGLFSE